MKNNYDISIVYRIYPGVSKVPPIHSKDKYKLSELCLASFANSLKGIKAKVWVLFDNCPEEYHNLFKKYLKEEDLVIIDTPGVGNGQTFKRQMDILLEQNDSEIVYFAEDDYFYLPNAFQEMISAIKRDDIDFLSPYDHLDNYNLKIHEYKSNIINNETQHWRESSTTCMTFMSTKKVLKKAAPIFYTYVKNNYDASLWLSLTKKKIFNPSIYFNGLFKDKMLLRILIKHWLHCPFQNIFGKKYKLYTPIPSLSTHMDSLYLAPTINWKEEFSKYE